MPSVCLYFQVHQPHRLRHYSYFDIGHVHHYEDVERNHRILDKVAKKCYIPANQCLQSLIERYKGRFRLAFSLTGVLLDQMETFRSDVLTSFKRLAETGCVEFLGETYHHSLAFIYSRDEFSAQVARHADRIEALFGRRPSTFRHTELVYNNDIAEAVERMGYTAILAEGAAQITGPGITDTVYKPAGCEHLRLLLRNYRLSDDVSFRFSNRDWPDYPLTAAKFAHWIHQLDGSDRVINLFMDYETFGEHQWRDTGIFDFLEELPEEILRHPAFNFLTPGEAAVSIPPAGELNVPEMVSWADTDRGLSAWLGNSMQKDAMGALYNLEGPVRLLGDDEMTETWRRLQTSDHFYYMCTKWFADGDVHKYFNPYASPYDAYINYMNILDDFSRQVKKRGTGHDGSA
ncbi:MAG: glycoside hydrolase family 57 protein [Syntrophales bacterium]|nr:glycoside hydrolase family 57 protein [Syntrophales bacterium]